MIDTELREMAKDYCQNYIDVLTVEASPCGLFGDPMNSALFRLDREYREVYILAGKPDNDLEVVVRTGFSALGWPVYDKR